MTSNQIAHPVMLPGIGNSGPRHWQTLWASRQKGCQRFQPADWDRPNLADWLQALDTSIDECAGPVVLVAHSLSCLLVAHWALRGGIRDDNQHRIAQVRGAFLVAVPDHGAPAFPGELRQETPAGMGVDEMSMGMSGDFELAIEEGATVVRVGQAIFGARATPNSHYWPDDNRTATSTASEQIV